jgi:anti-anti-sigma factor
MDISPVSERLVKITLAGRLDTPAVDRIEARLLAALVPEGNSAIVDLSQVDFVSSLGIRMIVSAARSLRMRQAALAIYGVQERVNQVFDIVSLGQVISICSTEAEALAALAPPVG